MQSHWEKLETIRVVDAGYLLAGMEPERRWQFAPPIVANFFNLIRDKTGAVKLVTLPGERMEITQAEFQALKAAYGVPSATALQQPAPAQNTTTPAPLLKPEARRGYVLALPDGQTHVQFGELAHLIADALWPDVGADDTRMTYGCTRVNLDAELVRAVKSGTLQVKDPLTFGPHTFPVGNALLSALVTVDEVREFVAGRGLTVETAKTQATTPSAAPVVAETTGQRRARWLDWYGNGERGAVQRVYERELLLNPKADRSFIGKEIDKAKNEKAETKRGGAMFGQLVQDGKRKG